LKAIEDKAGVLTVLKPLVLKKKSQLLEFVPQWKSEIDSLKLPENKATLLEELLVIGSPAFSQIDIKGGTVNASVNASLKISSSTTTHTINVTKSEKEAKEEGIKKGKTEGKKEGKEKGIKQGELIGEIRTLQRILKYPQSIQSELAEKPLKELRAMLQKLKADLG
jgi:flagellar biosynthesis/type III secretory pathway protein FliH